MIRPPAQQKETYIVKTLFGLEPLLIQELEQLGAENIQPLKRGASFVGDLRMLYRANLELRTAIRILKPFWHFRARDERELYDQVQRINWTKHLTLKHTFAIDSVTHSRFFRHSKYAGLKTKDAIVDQFRDRFDKRPNVNTVSPDLRLNVHIYEDEVNLAYDSSGDSLHMRGYRREVGDAPINEVLAAGMIMMTGWKGDSIFIDPMCGSGTLLAEAAMIATNTPPGWNRERFGFEKWKNFNAKIWEEVKAEAKAKIKTPKHPILGFDQD
ncbi:MAG: class I SAM-dependent RNA methyltransferase, partial [Saprospiraceae bacterium]